MDQLFVLALALNVAPAVLLSPEPGPDDLADGEGVQVSPTLTMDSRSAARWVIGFDAAPTSDREHYLRNGPPGWPTLTQRHFYTGGDMTVIMSDRGWKDIFETVNEEISERFL